MQVLSEDGMVALLAGLVQQAVCDWCDGHTHPRHLDAGVFLRSLGALSPAGELDPRFRRLAARHAQRPRGRKRGGLNE